MFHVFYRSLMFCEVKSLLKFFLLLCRFTLAYPSKLESVSTPKFASTKTCDFEPFHKSNEETFLMHRNKKITL